MNEWEKIMMLEQKVDELKQDKLKLENKLNALEGQLNIELKNNWTVSFNKFENEIIPVIEIIPKELNHSKYFRFVVERKPNEILYGFLKNKILDDFLKNNAKIKLEDMNIQTQYFEWYIFT